MFLNLLSSPESNISVSLSILSCSMSHCSSCSRVGSPDVAAVEARTASRSEKSSMGVMPSRSCLVVNHQAARQHGRRDTHLYLFHNPFLSFTECLQFHDLVRLQCLFAALLGGFL